MLKDSSLFELQKIFIILKIHDTKRFRLLSGKRFGEFNCMHLNFFIIRTDVNVNDSFLFYGYCYHNLKIICLETYYFFFTTLKEHTAFSHGCGL